MGPTWGCLFLISEFSTSSILFHALAMAFVLDNSIFDRRLASDGNSDVMGTVAT
jgi:hypothetical protein